MLKGPGFVYDFLGAPGVRPCLEAFGGFWVRWNVARWRHWPRVERGSGHRWVSGVYGRGFLCRRRWWRVSCSGVEIE